MKPEDCFWTVEDKRTGAARNAQALFALLRVFSLALALISVSACVLLTRRCVAVVITLSKANNMQWWSRVVRPCSHMRTALLLSNSLPTALNLTP